MFDHITYTFVLNKKKVSNVEKTPGLGLLLVAVDVYSNPAKITSLHY